MRPRALPVPVLFLAIVAAGRAQAAQAQDVEALAQRSGCLKCHGAGKGKVGPAFGQVARRYNRGPADFALRVVSADKAAALPENGKSEVVVGLVGDALHVRVFDAAGATIVDKDESALAQGPALAELKKQVKPEGGRDASALPDGQRRRVVEAALSAAGHRPADAREALINKVKKGGKGNWTSVSRGVPMPPFSERLSEEQIALLVDWVLGR